MSKTIIIKRAREARTFNRKGRYSRAAAISSLAKNERKTANMAQKVHEIYMKDYYLLI